MRQLILKNRHLVDNEQTGLVSLYTFLARQKLHGKKSRERTRFLKVIEPRTVEVAEGRKEIVERFTEKDAEGKILFVDKLGNETNDRNKGVNYKVLLENQEKINEEVKNLHDEQYVIDILPAQAEMIEVIRDLILNTEEAFDGAVATMYDEWCTAFESLKKVDDEGNEVTPEKPAEAEAKQE